MKASQAAIDLIKQFEGLRLQAYQDQKGVWTIGFGYTGPEVHQGLVWTEAQANMALVSRVNAIASILSGCIVPLLNQDQFDALVSLCYNIGQGAFRGSTLLRLINQRDFDEAADEFLKWDHVDGQVNPGLLSRRVEEMHLFNGYSL